MITAFMTGYMGKTATSRYFDVKGPRRFSVKNVKRSANLFLDSEEKLLQEAKRDFLENGPHSQKARRDRPGVKVQLSDIEKRYKQNQLAARVIPLSLLAVVAIKIAGNSEARRWVEKKYNSILGRE